LKVFEKEVARTWYALKPYFYAKALIDSTSGGWDKSLGRMNKYYRVRVNVRGFIWVFV
jgi:hypothetical protein